MNRRSSYDAHEAMKRNESQSRIRFIRPSLSVDPEDLARQQDASAAVVRAAMQEARAAAESKKLKQMPPTSLFFARVFAMYVRGCCNLPGFRMKSWSGARG